MRVRGQYGRFGLAYIECQISSQNPHFVNVPIALALDTGSSRTMMLDKDASALNLNYKKLTKVEGGVGGVGGRSEACQLCGVTIAFSNSQPPNHIEALDKICVLRHVVRTEKQRINVDSIPSVLGLDVLKKF